MKYVKYFLNKTLAEGFKAESDFVAYLDEENKVLYSRGGEVIKDGEMVADEVTLAGRTFPNNVIAYISADGNPIEFSGKMFDETCTSHTFDSNTKIGQWIFDLDLTRLGLLPNLTLKELSLPESITILQSTPKGSTSAIKKSKIFYNTSCEKLYYNCISAEWDTSYPDKGFLSGKIDSIIIGPNAETIPILYGSVGDVMPHTLEINTLHNVDITNLATLRNYVSTIKVTPKNIYLDSRDDCNAIIDSTINELLLACSNTIIPDSVVIIGEKAFYACKLLLELIIPDSVISVGSQAFKQCTNLRIVDFGSNIRVIGYSSFSNSGVEQIVLPDTVREIQANAFEYCANLTHLTFGHDLTKIDSRALMSCSKLENIYYNGTKAEWNAVEKYTQENYEWHYLIPATVVHCIDGDVTL